MKDAPTMAIPATDAKADVPVRPPAKRRRPVKERLLDSVSGLWWRVKRAVGESGISPLHNVEYFSGLLRMGEWLREKDAESHPYFRKRTDLFGYINNEIVRNEPIQYLEFGVFEGASIRDWSSKNQCPESTFAGFDTFCGLPEEWRLPSGVLPAGYFNVGGKLPKIEDARVRFVPGLFQDTLPAFLKEFNPQHRLVIHLDADLYSSTLYVLIALRELLVAPGTLLLFDEFSSVQSEFRAMADFESAFKPNLKFVAAGGRYYEHVALIAQ